MNKTINISLNGVHFNIDENAFHKLQKYLDQLEKSFQHEEGKEEIMQDIETRIAELFQSYLGLGRDVVSEQDVDRMIAVMGAPEEFNEEANENESAQSISSENGKQYNSANGKVIEKKLYRDLDERIIGGVLAGIAHYFGWNPTILRGIYIGIPLMSIFFDFGISTSFMVISYIVMWIIIPAAVTNIQKLEMYGTPVNVDSIKKNISSEEVKETINNVTGFTKEVVSDAAPVIESAAKGIFRVFRSILGFFMTAFGIMMMVGGFAFLIISLFTQSDFLQFGDLIFQHEWTFYAFIIAIFFLQISLASIFIYYGVRLLNRSPQNSNRTVVISALSIFFISLFTLIFIGTNEAMRFRDQITYKESHLLPIDSDTLNVNFQKTSNSSFYINGRGFNKGFSLNKKMDTVIIGIDNDLEIRKSNDGKFYLQTEYSVRGKNEEDAKRNVERIKYKYQLQGNTLLLNQEMYLPKNVKFRDQSIDLVLYVPDNKTIITQNVDDIYNEDFFGMRKIRDLESGRNRLIVRNDTLYCDRCKMEDYHYKKGNINIQGDDGKIIINEDSLIIKSKDGAVNINISDE